MKLKNISKSFDGKVVFSNYSLDISKGKIVCVTGESGSGKTTLINLILGLISLDSGAIEGVPEKVSVVFQEDRLCEDFSALKNVLMVSPDKARAEMLLCALGLENDLRTKVKTLSGGMKRRVALARALQYNGDMLIMDEGFKGLDALNRFKAMELIRREMKGRTVISVTHDKEELLEFAEEIVCIDVGRC